MKTRFVLGLFLPPIIKNLFKRKIWVGAYSNWEEIRFKSKGYDSLEILEKCKNALLEVVNNKAVYERDSVLFDEIQYNWGLLSGLLNAAICNNNSLKVVDFGGSLGSTYYQNRHFLKNIGSVEWAIVEQKHFVDCGNEYFNSDILSFHNSIDQIPNIKSFNVLLLSGVLQYLEFPRDAISDFLKYEFDYIIIDRTSFSSHEFEDVLTIQNVPEEIYKATYPCWFFGKNYLDAILERYELLGTFKSDYAPESVKLQNGELGTFLSYIFKRNDLCQN